LTKKAPVKYQQTN